MTSRLTELVTEPAKSLNTAAKLVPLWTLFNESVLVRVVALAVLVSTGAVSTLLLAVYQVFVTGAVACAPDAVKETLAPFGRLHSLAGS